MKRMKMLAACLALVLTMGVFAGNATPLAAGEVVEVFDPTQFNQWLYESGLWRTIDASMPQNDFNKGFVSDASGRPTLEQIESILNTAMLYQTARGSTDVYVVVVTCPETQNHIIGDWTRWGLPGAGTAVSEGTVTLLLFSEFLLHDENRVGDEDTRIVGGTTSFNPRRGYLNSGILSGYINMAAFSLGFGTRHMMAVDYDIPFPFLTGVRFPEMDAYLTAPYYIIGMTEVEDSTANMRFVQSIIIGTPCPDRPIETISTGFMRPANWSFFDTFAFGDDTPNLQPAALAPERAAALAMPQLTAIVIPEAPEFDVVFDLGELEDGVFTGTALGYFQGVMTVQVTVENGVIVDIDVLEHNESDVYFAFAALGFGPLPGIIEQILDSQDLNEVDLISGATGSSTAIILAVANALGH